MKISSHVRILEPDESPEELAQEHYDNFIRVLRQTKNTPRASFDTICAAYPEVANR